MTSAELLVDAFERVRDGVHQVVDGLTPEQLAERLDPGANSIAWLVWHLARVQDDHVAGAAGIDQVWTADGWAERFGLPHEPLDIGYGHDTHQVAAVQVESGDLLTGYYDAVHEQTVAYVATITDADLPTVVDRAWTPPVTLGVRLISVVGDTMEHLGQAEFIRGILERR